MTSLEIGIAVAGIALLGVVWAVARRQQVARGEPITLVASKYLGGKRFLTLVEVDGHRLLLGLAGEQVQLVARLTGPAGVESTAGAAGSLTAPRAEAM